MQVLMLAAALAMAQPPPGVRESRGSDRYYEDEEEARPARYAAPPTVRRAPEYEPRQPVFVVETRDHYVVVAVMPRDGGQPSQQQQRKRYEDARYCYESPRQGLGNGAPTYPAPRYEAPRYEAPYYETPRYLPPRACY